MILLCPGFFIYHLATLTPCAKCMFEVTLYESLADDLKVIWFNTVFSSEGSFHFNQFSHQIT